MKEWTNRILGDVIVLQRGFDITKKDQTNGVIPIISSSGIGSYHNKYKAKGPGVVTGRKGTLGKVHYISTNYWPHDTTLWVKDFKGNIPKFVYYYLQLMKLENYDVGASNPTLNRNHLHKIRIIWPSIPIQRKIAAILSTYDELIENNNRRIAILEKIAEEIYREWFVRLRFPGHENVKIVKGVPEGWEVRKMTQLNKMNFVTDKLKPFDGLKNYYATADIDGINLGNPTELIQYVNRPSRAQYNPYLYSVWFARMKNTFKVLAISNSNSFLCENTILSSGFVGFITEKYYFPYLFCLIKSNSFHYLKDMYTTGATQESLTNEGLSKIKVIFPNEGLLKKFGERMFDTIDKIFLLQNVNKNLKSTRDLLLPGLISGKLDVEKLDITFPPGMKELQEEARG